jgi:hypothetical protein
MKTLVTFNDFVDAFKAYDRYDNFGYDGLKIIFDYLEQYEEETGEEIELDVIAFCCDFTMLTIDDVVREYQLTLDGDIDDEEKSNQVLDYLYENTSVIGQVADSVIFQVF